MSVFIESLINKIIIDHDSLNELIQESDILTKGLVSSAIQDAVDEAICSTLVQYITENNIVLSDLPAQWLDIISIQLDK